MLTCNRLTVPLFLAQLLNYFEPDTTMSKTEAYYYASAIVVCTFISATSQHIFMLHNFHLGEINILNYNKL